MHLIYRALAVLPLLALGAASVHAQSYPTRNVLFISSVSGGVPEAVMRAMFDRVKQNTGAIFLFEPRAGGAGAPALQALKPATPDGHTLGITYQSALTLNLIVNPELGIDPQKDFVAVSNLLANITGIGTRADSPAKDIRDIVDMAKANPGAVRVGIVGTGNKSWLLMLESRTGARFLQVPFKQSSEAAAAGLGGHIDAWFGNIASMATQTGKVKVLAQGGAGPLPILPASVPLTRDLYQFDLMSWFGVIAPAGTPSTSINWVHRELVRALRTPEVLKMLEAASLGAIGNSPQEFAAALNTEIQQMRELARKYPDLR